MTLCYSQLVNIQTRALVWPLRKKESTQVRQKESLVIFHQCLSGWWAVSVINLNKSPNRGANAVGGNVGFIFLSGIQMVL